MIWLPVLVLHAVPAAAPQLSHWVLAATGSTGSGSDSSSSSSSGTTGSTGSSGATGSATNGSTNGASSTTTTAGSSSSASASGSDSGSSASASDSGSGGSGPGSTSGSGSGTDSGSTASSSGAAATATSGSNGGSTGQIGAPPGDQDQDTFGIPSHCNVGDDCPEQFNCIDHKCRPVSQNTPKGGCASAPGLFGAALLAALGLGLARRRGAWRPR